MVVVEIIDHLTLTSQPSLHLDANDWHSGDGVAKLIVQERGVCVYSAIPTVVVSWLPWLPTFNTDDIGLTLSRGRQGRGEPSQAPFFLICYKGFLSAQ